MATFFQQLFKPKWQSSNSKTRIEAVSNLDSNIEDQRSILAEIAKNDHNIDVAKAAIAKITDTTTLINIYPSAGKEKKAPIQEQLNKLAQAQSLTLFDLILDPSLLTELIIHSEQPDSFINGIARIQNPDALAKIAIEGRTSRIRQAATELLESEAPLLKISAHAKSKDKKVFQIAKAKLAAIKEQKRSQASINDRLSTILSSLNDLAKTDNTQQYDVKLKALVVSWKDIEDHATGEQKQAFTAASTQCEDRQAALQAALDKQLAEEQAVTQSLDERSNTLATLEQTLDRFREMPVASHELASLDAIVKTQETRWIEATKLGKVDKGQIKHYQVLISELRQYLKAATTLKAQAADLSENLVEVNKSSEDLHKLKRATSRVKQLLKTIDWPQSYAQPDIIQEAKKALGQSENIDKQLKKDSKEVCSKVDALLQKLDKSLEEKQIKQSMDIQRNINQLLAQLGAKQSERYHNQLSLYANQLRELKDWQSYAAQPRQLELCENMERLIDLHIEPQQKAEKIKAMQQEWKSLGGASDQALWQRFKEASDKAFEPCKLFNNEEKQLKVKNLEKRKLILEQLQDFIAKTNWDQADWKAIDKINRKARQEWKDAFPVDFKANKGIQNEFNQTLKEIDGHLDKERDANIKVKQDIVARAQGLAEGENIEEAINGAKALQKEWQQVGVTPHKQDRALWKDFRAACDQIFGRRNEEREAQQQELNQHLAAAEALLTEITQFNDAIKDETVVELETQTAQFRKRVKQLEPVGKRQQESMDKKFNAALKVLQSKIKAFKNKEVYSQWLECARKSLLCRQIFAAGNGVSDEQIAEFKSKVPLPNALEKSLESLWIQIKAGVVNENGIIDQEEARRLAIRCEVAAGLDSPAEDKEIRMQLQVSRLSEGLSSGAEHHSREEQLAALLSDWYQKVGPDSKALEPLETRIRKAIEQTFA